MAEFDAHAQQPDRLVAATETFFTERAVVFSIIGIGHHFHGCLGEVPEFDFDELFVYPIVVMDPFETPTELAHQIRDFRETGSQRGKVLRECIFNTD